MSSSDLTHFNDQARAHMVDVSDKKVTQRVAIARSQITMRPQTLDKIREGSMGKGDVLSVAQVAGIMAAKKTADMIPMCHPLPLTGVDITFEEVDGGTLSIRVIAKTTGVTGVEMEALTAAQIVGLTIYDMCKAVDKDMILGPTYLEHKSGGKSGTYARQEASLYVVTDQPIIPDEVTSKVKRRAAGAITLFLGTVREITHGRRTLYLDYEAYTPMAISQLELISQEVRDKWPDIEAAITHRIGHLQISDIAVAIAVSSPHRKAAYEANEYIIERIKQIVPIWKKEQWEDGSVWIGDQLGNHSYAKGE